MRMTLTRVRFDFEHHSLELGGESTAVEASNGVALELLNDDLVVRASLDGIEGLFHLDTGSSFNVELFRDWAESLGMLTGRTFTDSGPHAGIGSDGEGRKSVAFKASTFALGPVNLASTAVEMTTGTSEGRIAGRLGMGLFARCNAMTVDIAARRVSFERPCDRPIREPAVGIDVRKARGGAGDEVIVTGVAKVGAAAKTGLKVGDRLVKVGDISPNADNLRQVGQLLEHNDGANALIVVVEQGGRTRRMTWKYVEVDAADD